METVVGESAAVERSSFGDEVEIVGLIVFVEDYWAGDCEIRELRSCGVAGM